MQLHIRRGMALQRFIICVSGLSLSVSAHSADLLDIYHQVQISDPTYAAARYTLEATEQKIPQARAGLLPTVSINGTDNQTSALTTYTGTPPVQRDVNAWNWSLQLTQPLIRMQNLYAYRESKSQVDAARAQFDQDQQDLILRAAQAYFDVLVAQEGIVVAEAQVNAMDEQWAQAKRGYETGVNAVTDMHEARAKLEQARMQLIQAQNDLDDKRAALEQLTGIAPPHLAALLPGVVLPGPLPQTVQPWANEAENNNPLVRQQRMAMAVAENEISRNRAEYLPTLDLTASHGGNYSSGSLTTPTDYATQGTSNQVGVQLTIPLINGGATGAKVKEAMANYYKAQAQLEEARRKAATDAKQAFSGVMNGLAKIAALKSAIASGVSAVKGNKVGYQAGIRINSDVLSAEQQLYTSRRDLVKAQYDVLLQGLKLKAAAGILGEADVIAINEHLEKIAHDMVLQGLKLKAATSILGEVDNVTINAHLEQK
ncbi:MAG: TolC family outer membrane protein [Sulfuriferula sp.]|nr:TolC family outer membrane protein [Sulfuriferula sp.]